MRAHKTECGVVAGTSPFVLGMVQCREFGAPRRIPDIIIHPVIHES